MAACTPPSSGARPRSRAASALVRATGRLSTAATSHMEQDLSWFGDLSAEERSWVGQIVQAGIRDFVDWYRDDPADLADANRSFEVAGSVFGAAPRALTGTISLQQTVDLVRLSIEVVERRVDSIVHPDDLDDVHAAVLRYARDIAFATAEVYARAAEQRGAWDARLEALVVDSVLRAETDETMLSRASALGWGAHGQVAVVLGTLPERRTDTDLFDAVRRQARAAGMDALCATQGERLVVLLGAVEQPRAAGATIADLFGVGAVVVLLGEGGAHAGGDHGDPAQQQHRQDREQPHHRAGSSSCSRAATIRATASSTSSVSTIMSRSACEILPSASCVSRIQSSRPRQ